MPHILGPITTEVLWDALQLKTGSLNARDANVVSSSLDPVALLVEITESWRV